MGDSHDRARSAEEQSPSPRPQAPPRDRSPTPRGDSPVQAAPSRSPSRSKSPGEVSPDPPRGRSPVQSASPRSPRGRSPVQSPSPRPRSPAQSASPRPRSPADRSQSPAPRRRSPIRSPSPRPRSPPRRNNNARDRSPRGGAYRNGPPKSNDYGFKKSRRRTPPPEPTDEQKQAAAKAEYNRLLTARSGGVYVPPARLRALQAQVQDKSSKEYQRMAWEALKKSINGLVNKATAANMRQIISELFRENLVRGRGLLAQSLIKAQYASLPFTPVYACIAACVNSKLPAVGELLLRRLLLRFRKGFRRNDKAVCRSATTFLAHLVNTQVADEMIAAQMLLLLLHNPTDDSVEIAVNLTREVGAYLETMNPTVLVVVFDRFHHILNEADIDKRTQYAIEVLFQNRKDKFKDHPAVRDDLDLIEEEDQIKHMLELDGKFEDEATLNIFRYDEEWETHEKEYAKLRREILDESGSESGSDDESGSGSGSDSGSDSDDESSDNEEEAQQKALDIKDRTNADLVALRRTIYLTIQSSMNADEAVHKLVAVDLPEGREGELPSMVVECCSQEKTYTKFFGLIGERLAKLNRRWTTLFEENFTKYYETIHRYETNKLRNIACFFGHMLASDAIGWYVLEAIHLTEDDTTSASRIFIKILFQEMAEAMGMPKLQARLQPKTDENGGDTAMSNTSQYHQQQFDLQPSLEGLFPLHGDNPRNLRFSINYFTSIGMGALTESMRERLQNLPKPALPGTAAAGAGPAAVTKGGDDSASDYSDSASSYSSYTGSSYSRSRSRSRSRPRSPYQSSKQKATRGRGRSRSDDDSRYTRSPSPRSPPGRGRASGGRRGAGGRRSPTSRSRSRSMSYYSDSRSPSPAPRGRKTAPPRGGAKSRRSRSYSYTPSPSRSRSPVRNGRNGGRAGGGRARSPSYSRTPSPGPARRRRSLSYDSRTPSRSPSRTPPRGAASGRGRRARSVSTDSRRTPSPPPKSATNTRRRRRSESLSSEDNGAPRRKQQRN